MSRKMARMTRFSRPVGSNEPFRFAPDPYRALKRAVQEISFSGVHLGSHHPRTYITGESKEVLDRGIDMKSLEDALG